MDYLALLTAIADAHQQAQARAAGAVNRHLILRNWLIGAHLVEFQQHGEDRAAYGAGLLKRVAGDLRQRAVPGTSPDMLERMRLFYTYYPQVADQISAPLVRKSSTALPSGDLAPENSAPPVRNSPPQSPRPLPTHKLLELSWTHLADLIRLEDPRKRAFCENECLKCNWSVRQLQRQIGSHLYESTALSTGKQAAKAPAFIAAHARHEPEAQSTPTNPAPLHIPIQLFVRKRAINSPFRTNPLKLGSIQTQQPCRLASGKAAVLIVIKNNCRRHGAIQIHSFALGEDGNLFGQQNGDGHNLGKITKRKTFHKTGLQRGRAVSGAEIGDTTRTTLSFIWLRRSRTAVCAEILVMKNFRASIYLLPCRAGLRLSCVSKS